MKEPHSNRAIHAGSYTSRKNPLKPGSSQAHSNRAIHAGSYGWSSAGRHVQKRGLEACRAAGVDVVLVGSMRDDMDSGLGAEWLAGRPDTDVPIMLGLEHTLCNENLHDRSLLESHCVGFDRFLPYLTGEVDGQPKGAAWAAEISEIPADTLRALARRMAGSGRRSRFAETQLARSAAFPACREKVMSFPVFQGLRKIIETAENCGGRQRHEEGARVVSDAILNHLVHGSTRSLSPISLSRYRSLGRIPGDS